MIAAHIELTWKGLYMALVIYNIMALIIKLKKPNVIIIAGKLSITKTGRSKALTMPKIKLAITITHKLSAPMLLNNTEDNNSPKKLASQVNKNRLIIEFILPFLQIITAKLITSQTPII
jgi:hypothetical protein